MLHFPSCILSRQKIPSLKSMHSIEIANGFHVFNFFSIWLISLKCLVILHFLHDLIGDRNIGFSHYWDEASLDWTFFSDNAPSVYSWMKHLHHKGFVLIHCQLVWHHSKKLIERTHSLHVKQKSCKWYWGLRNKVR